MAVLALAGLAVTPDASAAPVGIACTGSSHADYSPPVTYTPQNVTNHVTENFSCTSLFTAVSSGTATSSTTVSNSNCLVALSLLPLATFTYHWNTGQSSTVTFNNTDVVKEADGTTEVTNTGAVTAGLGQGSTAVKVTVLPQISLTACATTGVDSITGPATLTILP